MSVAGVPTRKIKKALSEHGYVKDRCNDGHEIWEKQVTKSVSIPIHSKEINGAMAKRLNKQHNLDLF